jgi:hypothetical protein
MRIERSPPMVALMVVSLCGCGRDPLVAGAPVRLTQAQGGACAIALDERNLYWLDQDNGLHGVPKGGGDGTWLGSYPTPSPQWPRCALAVAGGGAYAIFSDSGPDPWSLVRIATDGSGAALIAALPPPADAGLNWGGIATDGSDLYLAYGGSIQAIPIAGGAPREVAAGPVWDFALTDAAIYYGDLDHGTVNRAPLGGGGGEVVAQQRRAHGFASLHGVPYWATGDAVERLVGDAVEMIASGEPSPAAVAVDAAGVYWADQGTPPSVSPALPGSIGGWSSGGSPFRATTIGHPTALALDGDAVYWLEQEGGIWRAPRF